MAERLCTHVCLITPFALQTRNPNKAPKMQNEKEKTRFSIIKMGQVCECVYVSSALFRIKRNKTKFKQKKKCSFGFTHTMFSRGWFGCVLLKFHSKPRIIRCLHKNINISWDRVRQRKDELLDKG